LGFNNGIGGVFGEIIVVYGADSCLLLVRSSPFPPPKGEFEGNPGEKTSPFGGGKGEDSVATTS